MTGAGTRTPLFRRVLIISLSLLFIFALVFLYLKLTASGSDDSARNHSQSAVPAPPPPEVSTYPNIEAPDSIASDREIAVQVSLSSEPITSGTRIVTGAQENGKLRIPMAGQNQMTITVVLSAPDLEFSKGGNTGEITLTSDGNSTVAAFFLRPKRRQNGEPLPPRETTIFATLYHDAAFLARLSHSIRIVPTAGTESGASARNVIPGPAAGGDASSPSAPIHADSFEARAPDLTIEENRAGNTLCIDFNLPPQAPIEIHIEDAKALHDWITAHFQEMARHSRGFEDAQTTQSPQGAIDSLEAFGNQLYDRIVPEELRPLMIQALATGKLRTIQVLSDDPAIPWELMRPLNPADKQREEFLGEQVAIARWPLMTRLTRPTQSLSLTRSVVVAPQYSDSRSLPAAEDERATLLATPNFSPVDGTYDALRNLALDPPHGFVHFAGHGVIRRQNGIAQYAIVLKDGEVSPETWASLSEQHPDSGTIYFFNACEVGESGQFMNEVDGWAPALLGSGGAAYIGALWAISDSTADRFAQTFYKSLTDEISAQAGANVSEVMTKTRRKVFAETHDPTALAYVFYGDPKLRVH